MKTLNKDDIRALKAKHRLELVMQETGESFEVEANPDHWKSKITPGLIVDIHCQVFEIKKPGMDTEAGDVIAWLRHRYPAWTFGQAVSFLQKRPPDPKQETPRPEIKSLPKYQESDFITIAHEYIDPATGARSYGLNYNYERMDSRQKRALEIAGDWAIKYFTKSSDELWEIKESYPHRFKAVMDFEIEKCANCEKPFNWQVFGMVAYAQEKAQSLEIVSDSEDVSNLYIEQEFFIDSDFVICEKCLRVKYAPRYKALELVWRSAYKRKEAETQEQRKRDHEAWLEADAERVREQERQDSEAAYAWGVEQEKLQRESAPPA